MLKTKYKYCIKNILVTLLFIGVHVLALFSAPTFFESDYSRKNLIETYCNRNMNGSSIIFNSSVTNSDESVQEILNYKNNNDVELNSVLGLSLDGVQTEGISSCLVGSITSSVSNYYNTFRVYSDYNWNTLESEDYVFISDSMGKELVPKGENPKDYREIVKNKVIEIKISEVTYSFKIAGFYDTYVTDGGWRSRGNYFNTTFSNCIFVSEKFLLNKFTNVFQLITSDAVESGRIFSQYESLINNLGGEILTPDNAEETEVLHRIATVNRKNNLAIRVVSIVFSSVIMFVALALSIYLFDLNGIFKKIKWAPLLWCLLFVFTSYGFVFATKGLIINIFGFIAPGANKVSISMMSIYTFILAGSISIRYLWHRKKQINDKIVHYDI